MTTSRGEEADSRREEAEPAIHHAPTPVQQACLEILGELGRRCDEAGLRWFVLGGTLLGAVRHDGFIPWDDDVDVGMPRPDYERFEALCLRARDPRFAWQSARTDPAYPFAYGKLQLTASRAIDPAVAHLGVGDTLFVDVFPIDGAPAGGVARAVHRVALKLAVTALGARIRRRGAERVAGYAFRLVPRPLALAVLDLVARRYPFDGSAWAVNAAGAWGYRRECQPRARFVPTITLPFEGLAVPAPGAWEPYLTTIYGDFRALPAPAARVPRHALDVTRTGLEGHHDVVTANRPPEPAAASRPAGLLRTVLTVLGTIVVRAGSLAGRLRPPRPAVALLTRDAAHPGGNLVAIRDELARCLPSVRVHEIAYQTRGGVPGALVSVREAFAVGYHLAADRLVVADDWVFPLYAAPARPGTTRVQVWHAAGAFKRFGFSVSDARTPLRSNYDLVLASSGRAAGLLTEPFRLPRERFTSAIGLPRTDALYDAGRRAAAVAALRARYDLQPGARLLLYAPTFRADPRDARHPQELDLKAVRDGLAPDWRLLLRLHPLVRSADRTPDDLAGFVVDVSDWPDMNELLLVADMLVTDYSSAVFEYALLGRPIAFFAPDVEAYEAERGFYLEVPEDLPGPLFTTTSALVDHVRSAHADLDRIHEFARTWFDVADGQATERFVERIVRPALRGEPVQVEPEPAADERRVLPVPGA